MNTIGMTIGLLLAAWSPNVVIPLLRAGIMGNDATLWRGVYLAPALLILERHCYLKESGLVI